MNTPALALCLLAVAVALPARAQQGAAPLAALNQARAQGCQGQPGHRSGLGAEPRLDRAAERLAQGQPLQAALAAEGYRAQRAAMVALRGYRGSAGLAQGMRQKACNTLLDGQWQHAGVHLQGDASWLVFAAPFSPPQPQEEAQIQAEMLQRVNQARAQARQCGAQFFGSAGPLRLQPQLHRAALAHAADMAEHSYFSHGGRDGSQVGDRASRAGYAWQRIGENLAAGQTTAAQAVQGWLASPGHCANLMQPAYTEMGLAYVVNLRSTEGIYWVQVLGTPR